MEKINEHIERLLCYHEYVVVPGWGGFVLQRQSAQLNGLKIKAPYTTISFNPLMQHSDGLLAIEVARAESISYRKAVENVESAVAQMKATLKTHNYLNMGVLGVFETDAAGSVTYTPANDLSFIPANIGMLDITLKSARNMTVVLPTAKSPSKSMRIGWRYAAAAVLLLSFMLVSPELSDSRLQTANLFPVNSTSEIAVTTPEDALNTDLESEALPVVEADEIAPAELSIAPVVADENPYHVIVASLPTAEMADNFCRELQLSHYTSVQVLAKAKLYRVSIQSFDDRDEAIRYMEELRLKDERFESAWVFCK